MGEKAWVHNLFAFLPLLPECGEDNWNHYITSSVDRITGIIHSKLWHWPAKGETLQLIVKTKKGRRQRKEKSKQVVENSEYSSCCRSLVNSRPGLCFRNIVPRVLDKQKRNKTWSLVSNSDSLDWKNCLKMAVRNVQILWGPKQAIMVQKWSFLKPKSKLKSNTH